MAPLPVIANTYRVALDWYSSAGGQIAENVIHVRKAGSTAAAIGADVIAAFQAAQWVYCSNTASIRGMDITPLDGSSATLHLVPSTGHRVGAQTGDYDPNFAAVVSFYTAKRGRSYRGRFYTPFIADASRGDGTLVPGANTTIAAGWVAFAAALTGTGEEHVVASYHHATADVITSYIVQTGGGTQRRRQTRVRYP